MIYLLIGYMWLFIHRPFEVWPWLAALRVERVYMIATLAYWLLQPKVWPRNRLNVGVALLATSMVVSAVLSPYEGVGAKDIEDWFKLVIFWLLLVTSIRSLEELKTIIVAFVVIMGLYEFHSLREYLCGRGSYKMGTWRMIGVDVAMGDPNSFAASTLYGLPMLLPVAVLVTAKWHRVVLWGLLALGLGCIALTGSRTAFVAVILFSAVFGMLSSYRWHVLVTLAVAIPLLWINMSADLQSRYLTLIDSSQGPVNAQESADQRKAFFLMSIEIWKDYPLFGVGPGCFRVASGTGMYAHTLYGETISELGLLGAVAVAALVVGFYRNYREARDLSASVEPTCDITFCYRTILAVQMAVLLMLFLGFGGHNLFRYTWLWYAAFSSLALKFLHEAVAKQAHEAMDTMGREPGDEISTHGFQHFMHYKMNCGGN